MCYTLYVIIPVILRHHPVHRSWESPICPKPQDNYAKRVALKNQIQSPWALSVLVIEDSIHFVLEQCTLSLYRAELPIPMPPFETSNVLFLVHLTRSWEQFDEVWYVWVLAWFSVIWMPTAADNAINGSFHKNTETVLVQHKKQKQKDNIRTSSHVFCAVFLCFLNIIRKLVHQTTLSLDYFVSIHQVF